jgi:predicted nucleotidyltransferase
VLVTLQTLRLEKRSAILDLARIHGATNVRIFGSVARNENGPSSDVDFLVDLEAGRDLFDLGGLQADLRDLLATSVDLVESTCLHPYIRDRVLAEAIPL